MSNGYGKQATGFGISREQSIDLIVQTCVDNGVIDTRQIAYVLATAQHESNNFRSPDEDWGRKQAVTLAYHGGEEYYGRGYAHLTHYENYRDMGAALGMGNALVVAPQRAAEAEIATRILVLGMRDGEFVPGQTLARYIDERQADYSAARAIVNPRDADSVARIAASAQRWETQVPAIVDRLRRDGLDLGIRQAEAPAAMRLARGDASQDVFEMQQYLAALGVRDDRGREIAPDGDFGPGTEQAVRRYQHSRGVEPPTGEVDATLFAQLRVDTLQAQPDFRRRTMTDLHGPLRDGELTRGDRGEPVFEARLQLEGLGYIESPRRNWSTDRVYDLQMEVAVRRLQSVSGITVTGVLNEATRRELNDLATARGLAPTTEFDRTENWPPQPPPYTRAEFQREQAAPAHEATAPAQGARAAPPVPHGTEAAPIVRGEPAPRGREAARQGDGLDGEAAALHPSDPHHPHHALYTGCAAGVDALDRQLGRAPDARSDRMAASLAALAARSGFERVDHVVLSISSGDVLAGQNVFVVQGALHDPAHRRAHLPTDVAVTTPIEASLRTLAQLDAEPAQERAPTHSLRDQQAQVQATHARHT